MTDVTPSHAPTAIDLDMAVDASVREKAHAGASMRPKKTYERVGVPSSLWTCLDPEASDLSDLSVEDALTGRAREAVAILQYYFEPLRVGGHYTGGSWDTFDPSGTRTSSAYVFTADDIASTALLSAELDGASTWDVLVGRRDRLSELLHRVGPDRDFVDEPDVSKDGFRAAWDLWAQLRAVPGLGSTRVSKLMARKRPRLIPILDSVVLDYTFDGKAVGTWGRLHHSLGANDRHLHRTLLALRDLAQLPPAVSALRVLDVLVWMEGTSQAQMALDAAAGV